MLVKLLFNYMTMLKKLLISLLFFSSIHSSYADRVIDTGEGIDTIIYDGDRWQYNVKITGGFITVDGDKGVDTISNAEFMQFDDITIRTSDLLPVPIIELPTYVQLQEGEYVEVLLLPSYRVLAGDFSLEYESKGVSGILGDNIAEIGKDFKPDTGTININKDYEPVGIRTETINDIDVETDEYYVVSITGQDIIFIQGGKTDSSAEILIKVIDDDIAKEDGIQKKPISKQQLYKNLILSKSELRLNVKNADAYIAAFDIFTSKKSGEIEYLNEILEKIDIALPNFGNSQQHKQWRAMFLYLKSVIEVELLSE